jgi:hypothetical protein
MGKIEYSYVNEYVVVPSKVRILLQDVGRRQHT